MHRARRRLLCCDLRSDCTNGSGSRWLRCGLCLHHWLHMLRAHRNALQICFWAMTMQTVRKRIHFKCPACNHERNYALLIAKTKGANRYVCENCGIVSRPRNYLVLNILHGSLLGAIVGLLAYLLFTQYMHDSTPALAILAATPFVLIVSWVLIPIYSKFFYKWEQEKRDAHLS